MVTPDLTAVAAACPRCGTIGLLKPREFSHKAWHALLVWQEVDQALAEKPVCNDCYFELREILIDRADEVDVAATQKPSATPMPKMERRREAANLAKVAVAPIPDPNAPKPVAVPAGKPVKKGQDKKVAAKQQVQPAPTKVAAPSKATPQPAPAMEAKAANREKAVLAEAPAKVAKEKVELKPDKKLKPEPVAAKAKKAPAKTESIIKKVAKTVKKAIAKTTAPAKKVSKAAPAAKPTKKVAKKVVARPAPAKKVKKKKK